MLTSVILYYKQDLNRVIQRRHKPQVLSLIVREMYLASRDWIFVQDIQRSLVNHGFIGYICFSYFQTAIMYV
jgi:hypothetical protein